MAAKIKTISKIIIYDNKRCFCRKRRTGCSGKIVCSQKWVLLHDAITSLSYYKRKQTFQKLRLKRRVKIRISYPRTLTKTFLIRL